MIRYLLRTVDKNLRAYNKFKWPALGKVVCPDWERTYKCGNGFHACCIFDHTLDDLIERVDGFFQVVKVNDRRNFINLCGKYKFKECEVVLTTRNVMEAFNFIFEKYQTADDLKQRVISKTNGTWIYTNFKNTYKGMYDETVTIKRNVYSSPYSSNPGDFYYQSHQIKQFPDFDPKTHIFNFSSNKVLPVYPKCLKSKKN